MVGDPTCSFFSFLNMTIFPGSGLWEKNSLGNAEISDCKISLDKYICLDSSLMWSLSFISSVLDFQEYFVTR